MSVYTTFLVCFVTNYAIVTGFDFLNRFWTFILMLNVLIILNQYQLLIKAIIIIMNMMHKFFVKEIHHVLQLVVLLILLYGWISFS